MSPSPIAQDLQSHLGRQLRAVYREMADQPVPDRFVRLLDELEQRHGASPPGGGAGGDKTK